MRWLVLIILTSCNSSEGEGLPEISYIGRSFEDATSKFGQFFNGNSCSAKLIASYEKKYGPNIKCFLTKHKKINGQLMIQITTSNETIVESRFTWVDTTARRSNIQIFPRLSDYFDSEPLYVRKLDDTYGRLSAYMAIWDNSSGRAYVTAICPLIPKGEREVTEVSKLRNCYLQRMAFHKKINEEISKKHRKKDKSF
ncbi:MAG: hypothetical protein ACPGJV_11665 [Bacteriovoracaceae bacterium]